jgi:uncharacterized protein (TIGR01777 family)
VTWDPDHGELDVGSLDGCNVFVNLSGAPLADRRLSRERKAEVLQSRVRPTNLLAQAAATLASDGGVLVNASAIGFYGDRGDEELTEVSPSGSGFLADLCRQWESATGPAEKAGVRVVHLRTGIVLAREGGALKKQLPLFKLGLGGTLGTGRQWTSWISLADEVAVIRHAVDNSTLSGPLNAVSPEPITNAGLTKALARAVHRPAFLNIPSPALKLAFGSEFAKELLLVSQRVLPSRLAASGYRFLDSNLDSALETMLGTKT